MLKYFDAKDKYVVDEPSLWTVNGSVDIQYAGGTEHKSGNFTIQVGNIESYNPTELDSEPEPEIIPTPTPSGGEDTPSGGGDEPGGGGETPGGDTPVTPEPTPTGSGIIFRLTNNCGREVRLSGKVILNVSKSPTDWTNSTQVNANFHPATVGSSWAYNDIIIPIGGTYTSPAVTTIDGIYMPSVNFLDNSWYFMNTDDPNNIYQHSIKLYSRIWNTQKNESSGSDNMYWIGTPPQNTKLQNGKTINLVINNTNSEATLQPNNTGHYVILEQYKTSLS